MAFLGGLRGSGGLRRAFLVCSHTESCCGVGITCEAGSSTKYANSVKGEGVRLRVTAGFGGFISFYHTLFEEQYHLLRQEEEGHTQKDVLLCRLRERASKDAADAVLTAEDAGS